MRLEHYSVEKLKQDILTILREHLDLAQYRVFFFGSRISGSGNARADIDVGIEGQKPISPEVLFQIQEKLKNLPILYKIDVVDFRRASKEFRDVAFQNIEMISQSYEKT